MSKELDRAGRKFRSLKIKREIESAYKWIPEPNQKPEKVKKPSPDISGKNRHE
jgi:hypothetical protein